jgi:hypothetical protein
VQQKKLLDHLVGKREELFRNRQAKRLGGPGIEHELEPGWLLDWNIGRACAVQNLVHMARRASRSVVEVGAVAKERALAGPRSPA